MKSAASSIAIWFLLMSPAGMFNREPYSWWKFVDSFPTRKMCEEVRIEFEKQMLQGGNYMSPDFIPGPARCVSDDDPSFGPLFIQKVAYPAER